MVKLTFFSFLGFWVMKKGSFFTFLIFVLFFLLPLSCAYSSFDVLAEADFLTNGVKYEAVDTENLFLNKENCMGAIPNPFSPLLFSKDNLFEKFSQFSLSIPVIQTSSLLRC